MWELIEQRALEVDVSKEEVVEAARVRILHVAHQGYGGCLGIPVGLGMACVS